MNSNVNLINAGKYLNRICADMSVSKLYYYNIQYTLSTTILEYQLKHNLTSKDMANYLKISPKMLYKYESGNYNFSLSQILSFWLFLLLYHFLPPFCKWYNRKHLLLFSISE